MNSPSPAVLVTGGAGYVGSETVRVLIKNGFLPVVIDNLSTGFRQAIPDVPFFEGDVRDIDLLNLIFKAYQISAVIHLAAKIVVQESICDPIGYYDNNINGLLNILQVCKKFSVKKFIFSSSATIYGNSNQNLDSAEVGNRHELLSETSLIAPISPYGTSKYFGEKILEDAKKDFGINSICLRYFNVAGASIDGLNGQRRLVATHIVHVASCLALSKNNKITIFGNDYQTLDGTCVRDYIHVEDIADIHVQALKHLGQNSESHVLNCGYGIGYSVKQVVDTFNEVNNVDLKILFGPRRLGDPTSLICNGTKLNKLFQWKPKHADLRVICKSAYLWQKKVSESLMASNSER
ncbi:MAG: UDP-glucose 4-epimerase GalE [Pseudobdellovibrio sp.]